jgi:hypothetical protein
MINVPVGPLHRHGDDWSPMEAVDDREHTPEDHDVERKLLHGKRVYRCTSCDAQFAVGDPEEE